MPKPPPNDLDLVRYAMDSDLEPTVVADEFDSLPYDGTNEEDSKVEMSEVLKAFKAAAKNEQTNFAYNTDGRFYTCLVFQSMEQRDVFWQELRIVTDDNQYVNGNLLARKLKINLPDVAVPKHKRKINADYAALSKSKSGK